MTNFQIERMLDIPISIIVMGLILGLFFYAVKNLRNKYLRTIGASASKVRRPRIIEIDPVQKTIEEPVRRYAGF